MKNMIFTSLFFMAVAFSAKGQVAFIGHRGASYLAPENTVASANLAWKLDADAMEIDIHLTKDKKVMVHHDSNTKRQTGVDLKIAETKSSELRKLDAGSFKGEEYKGEKIPFFDEIIKTIPPGKKLVVEIKCGSEVLPYAKKIIEKSGKKDQIVFISFNWKAITDAKKMMPENKCYWLCADKNAVMDKLTKVKDAGLDGLDLSSGIVDQDLMAKVNELGLEMICWTVDDPKEAQRLINLGVIGITTNRPAWLKEQVSAL